MIIEFRIFSSTLLFKEIAFLRLVLVLLLHLSCAWQKTFFGQCLKYTFSTVKITFYLVGFRFSANNPVFSGITLFFFYPLFNLTVLTRS